MFNSIRASDIQFVIKQIWDDKRKIYGFLLHLHEIWHKICRVNVREWQCIGVVVFMRSLYTCKNAHYSLWDGMCKCECISKCIIFWQGNFNLIFAQYMNVSICFGVRTFKCLSSHTWLLYSGNADAKYFQCVFGCTTHCLCRSTLLLFLVCVFYANFFVSLSIQFSANIYDYDFFSFFKFF